MLYIKAGSFVGFAEVLESAGERTEAGSAVEQALDLYERKGSRDGRPGSEFSSELKAGV
jgi:hypothetical protein